MNSVLTNCVQSVTLIRSWGAMKIIRAEPPEMFTVHIPSQSLKLFTSGERLNSCAMLCSVTQCVRLCDPTGCSLPGSSLRGIPQARILEWVGISFSRGSSEPGVVSSGSPALAGRFFTTVPTLVNYVLFYFFRPKFCFPVFQNPPN